jgi:hypothetical protein
VPIVRAIRSLAAAAEVKPAAAVTDLDRVRRGGVRWRLWVGVAGLVLASAQLAVHTMNPKVNDYDPVSLGRDAGQHLIDVHSPWLTDPTKVASYCHDVGVTTVTQRHWAAITADKIASGCMARIAETKPACAIGSHSVCSRTKPFSLDLATLADA